MSVEGKLGLIENEVATQTDLIGQIADALQGRSAPASTQRNYGNTLVLGDSLGAGYHNGASDPAYSYVTYLQSSGRFGTITNLALSGSAICYNPADWCLSAASIIGSSAYEQQISNADTIILEYGGNDASYIIQRYVSFWNVIEVMNRIIVRINTLNPGCKILFVMSTAAPSYIPITEYDKVHEYLSACIATICDIHNVQFVHMYAGVGVNAGNAGHFLQSDSTHLLPNLAQMVANRIVAVLDSGETLPKPTVATAWGTFSDRSYHDNKSTFWMQSMGVSTVLNLISDSKIFTCSPGWMAPSACQWTHINTNGGETIFIITLADDGAFAIQAKQL